jgi:hypothetical protein
MTTKSLLPVLLVPSIIVLIPALGQPIGRSNVSGPFDGPTRLRKRPDPG